MTDPATVAVLGYYVLEAFLRSIAPSLPRQLVIKLATDACTLAMGRVLRVPKEIAERLGRLLAVVFSRLNNIVFTTSGSEANETSPEVLSTGVTEAELKDILERRDGVLRGFEQRLLQHARTYEMYQRQAIGRQEHHRYYLRKVEEQRIKHDNARKMYVQLVRQQLFLTKLLYEHKQDQVKDTVGDIGSDIDASDFSDITLGIEKASNRE